MQRAALMSMALFMAIFMAGCEQLWKKPETTILQLARQAPTQAKVGESITIRLTVTVKQAVLAVSVQELLGELSIVDPGDLTPVGDHELRGVMLQPAAGTTKVFIYKVRCNKPIPHVIAGSAETQRADPAFSVSTITCTDGS